MTIKQQELKKELVTLKEELNSRVDWSKEGLIRWVGRCVHTFSDLGVDTMIITSFIQSFEPKTEVRPGPYISVDKEKRLVMGPFVTGWTSDSLFGSVGSPFFNLDKDHFIPSQDYYYAHVAFASAEAMLHKQTSAQKLCPEHLKKHFSGSGNTSVLSALEALDSCSESGDTDGLVKNSITLLDVVLMLDPELSRKKDLSARLNSLLGDKTISQRFGVSAEIVKALNSARIIRNYKSVHKKLPLEYDVPHIVALSFGYLVLFFIEVTVATGEVSVK